MNYRNAFTEAHHRSLLSSSLSYPSPGGGYGLSSPVSSAPAPTVASISPVANRNLLLSSTCPLDRTIRLHRRDLANTRPMGISLKPERPVRRRLPSAAVSCEVRQRKRFLVFTKILLKCLKRTNDERLLRYAKAIIADCVQRNRRKDPQCMPLPQAVERHLRPVVGETQWKRAEACLDLYLEKRRQLIRAAAADPLNVFPELTRRNSTMNRPAVNCITQSAI